MSNGQFFHQGIIKEKEEFNAHGKVTSDRLTLKNLKPRLRYTDRDPYFP